MDVNKLKEIGYSIVDAKLSKDFKGKEDLVDIADGFLSQVADICAEMIIAYENSKNE